jgi:hypothetical protein
VESSIGEVSKNNFTTALFQSSYDDEEEEVDSDDDMEYTEDAIDNMILEFSRD